MPVLGQQMNTAVNQRFTANPAGRCLFKRTQKLELTPLTRSRNPLILLKPKIIKIRKLLMRIKILATIIAVAMCTHIYAAPSFKTYHLAVPLTKQSAIVEATNKFVATDIVKSYTHFISC